MVLIRLAKWVLRVDTTPSPNSQIGGVPSMLYLNLPAGLAGRGGAVRIFMRATGIEFKQTLVTFEEWGSGIKKKVQEIGDDPAAHLPIITLNDKKLTEHTSVLRLWSRQLGIYGQDPFKDFTVDQMSDEYQAWRTDFGRAFSSGDDDIKKQYIDEQRPFYYRLFNELAKRSKASGAHLVGDKLSFADALVFSMISDDMQLYGKDLLSSYPVLAAFYKAFGEQDAVKNYTAAAPAASK